MLLHNEICFLRKWVMSLSICIDNDSDVEMKSWDHNSPYCLNLEIRVLSQLTNLYATTWFYFKKNSTSFSINFFILRNIFSLIWDRHNLFEGRSPIILRGRREKGMYYLLVLLKFFFKLFGWSYLSFTYGCSVHFTYAALLPRIS